MKSIFFRLPSFFTKKTNEVKEFDCEIEITRMFDLIKDGWKIKLSEDFNKYFNGTKMELLIGIFGDKFSGKTFLLQKIINEALITDRDLKRMEKKEEDSGLRSSLFFKINKENNIIFLDSLGSNLTPKSLNFFNRIKQIDENLDEFEKAKRRRDYETIAIINELFIRNFVINISSICLFVCPYLNGSILHRLNVIKSQFTKKVIIVHNIPSLGTLNDIDIYYNEILNPELNLVKCPIVDTNYHYYTSTEMHNEKEEIILHVILGNDNNKEIKEYNNTIINYLRLHIMSKPRKEFDLKEKLKHFCEAFARQYFDVKQKPNLAIDVQSIFVSQDMVEALYKKSFIQIQDNLISYQIVPKEQLPFYNLRFKNITLDFITGKEQKNDQLKITQYKIYYCGSELFVEFYPLGNITIDKIDLKIYHHSKYQKIEVKGEYIIDKIKNKDLTKKEEIITDSVSRYKSFILEDYVSIDYCLLKKVINKEIIKNGLIKITIEISHNIEGVSEDIDLE